MLVTFKNKAITKSIDYIYDPFAFLISSGVDGIKQIKSLSNHEYITIELNHLTEKFRTGYNIHIKPILTDINTQIKYFLATNPTFLENKENFYTEFKIPKKKKDSRGRTRWRKLINPHPALKALQRAVTEKLQIAGLLPHNAAHAFRENRDYLSNAAYHKENKHIINLDLKDFFDSISESILYENLKLHPIFNVDELGQEVLENIVKIATYKGATPQGSPLSPFLSNMIMVNFDFRIRKALNQNQIATKYTRYADDMTFSSKKSQDITHIIKMVEDVLKEHYHSQIKINYAKTKKIVPGRCFITGVKLNQEHNLTVGWEKKKVIKSRIYNLAKLVNSNKEVTDEMRKEAYSILGYLSFMNNIETNYVSYLHRKYKNELETIKLIPTACAVHEAEDIFNQD